MHPQKRVLRKNYSMGWVADRGLAFLSASRGRLVTGSIGTRAKGVPPFNAVKSDKKSQGPPN